jgi:hypothetical protein
MKMNTSRTRTAVLLIGLLLALAAVADAQTSTTKYNLLGESIGVAGYDPVSYFPEGGGKPQKGLISLSYQYDGVTYRFATEEDREKFKANPATYIPAYGGWCAWAVGELGKRVDVDPLSFEIRNGRLLLFYRDPKLDTRALWLKKPDAITAKADANWPALSK